MLRVYFGPKENAIYNTSVNFRNNYDKKWLLDDFARDVIKDIDNSEVLDSYAIKSPVLGIISPEDLSGGAKALILITILPAFRSGVYVHGDLGFHLGRIESLYEGLR